MNSLVAKLSNARDLDPVEPERWLLGAVSDARIARVLPRIVAAGVSADKRREMRQAVARKLLLACWDWLRARCDERHLTHGAPDMEMPGAPPDANRT